MGLLPTPSQTVGPFFHIGLLRPAPATLLGTGEVVRIHGRVQDGDGKPVTDALIETWQADADGRYPHPQEETGFRGFARMATDERGAFQLTTIKPGRVPGPAGQLQAPHLLVSVFMRGLLKRLVTRIYFPGDPDHADDPILKLVPPGRRHTLIAHLGTADKSALEWKVFLQGPDETVFFDA